MADYVDVVMTVGPYADGEFVELEDDQGRGVGESSGIRWIKPGEDPDNPNDTHWRLRIPWDAIAPIGEA